MWKIIFTKQAQKDIDLVSKSKYKGKLFKLLQIISTDPYQPPVEKLIGNLEGMYSRRINIQHRLVYEILEDVNTIKILSAWTHYGDN